MRTPARLCAVLWIVYSYGGHSCYGSVVDLAPKADAIVVGHIESRVESSTNISFDLEVDRVIKGDKLLAAAHVSHDWQRGGLSSDQGAHTYAGSFDGLWFLFRSTPTAWDVLPATQDGFIFSLFLPAVKDLAAPYQYTEKTSFTDRLVYETAAVLESTPQVRQYVSLPSSLKGPALDSVLARFVNSHSLALQLIGLEGMLAQSNAESLIKLRELWPNLKTDPSCDHIVSVLRNRFRDTKPESILRLVEIADASNSSPSLRDAAIRAMTAVHTKESLPFAATLLDSSVIDERMRGVCAISSFANGCSPQTADTGDDFFRCNNPSPYRTSETMANLGYSRGPDEDQSRLVSSWQDWWLKHERLIP